MHNQQGQSRKYNILETLSKRYPGAEYVQMKKALLKAMKMTWSQFKSIAEAITTDHLAFAPSQLEFIASYIDVKPRDLFSAPKYRIVDIINQSMDPRKIRKSIFEAMPFTSIATRNKWNAMEGEKGFTSQQESKIAELLGVAVEEIFYRQQVSA